MDNKTSDGENAELTDEEGKLEIDVQQEDEGIEETGDADVNRSDTFPPSQMDISQGSIEKGNEGEGNSEKETKEQTESGE